MDVTSRGGQRADVPSPRRIVVVSAAVGAGHDGPADEIARRLRRRGHRVARRDGLSILPLGLGRALRAAYFAQLRLAPTSWAAVLAACAGGRPAAGIHHALDRLTDRTAALLGGPADAVVSTYPLVSQLLGRLRYEGRLEAPVLSYLTDAAVHPLWHHPGVDAVLAAHQHLAIQIREFAPDGLVLRCAPAVAPRFGAPVPATRVAAVRRRLRVPDRGVFALVTSGSAGTGDVRATAVDLAALGAVPVVACGRNAALRRRVERLGVGPALGWVDDMPSLLAAADVVVQNAGGLACWEALVAGRPVVTHRALPGHGAANAAVLESAGLVPWTRSAAELGTLLSAPAPIAGPLTGPDPADVVERAALGQLLTPVGGGPEQVDPSRRVLPATARPAPREVAT